MDQPPRRWYRKKRWWATGALLASMIYTPFLLGDAMYVAGREGKMSAATVVRLVFRGRPTPMTGGLVSRYQWHLVRRHGQGERDGRAAVTLGVAIEKCRRRLADAEGAEARATRGMLEVLEAELGRTDAPFWYRWAKGEKARRGLLFETAATARTPVPRPGPR